MLDIITPEDEILPTVLITALAQLTEPLPPAIAAQLREIGKKPPAQLTDEIQEFLETLNGDEPLLVSFNAIERKYANRQQRGKLSPPALTQLEHITEIRNSFTRVIAADDIRTAAQTELPKIEEKTRTDSKG
jgi:hypothetical protein